MSEEKICAFQGESNDLFPLHIMCDLGEGICNPDICPIYQSFLMLKRVVAKE